MSVAVNIDAKSFREALGRFATGVTVVTGISENGAAIGITVNSFTSVSLDPPLVLFCIGLTAPSCETFSGGGSFALNVLSEDQEALSNNFATPLEDKFKDIDFDTWELGCPILKGCLANLECRHEAVYDGGDHKIIVGRVENLVIAEAGHPLLYFQGQYARLGNAG